MPQYFRLIVLALLLSVGMGSVGSAASFDCNKATTETEIAICADPELSALDDLMSAVYLISKEISKDDSQLKSEQKQWIASRDQIKVQRDAQSKKLRDNYPLKEKVHLRIKLLLNTLVGHQYDNMVKLLADSGEITFESDNLNRIIIFKTKSNHAYSNALFFDDSNVLSNTFSGDAFSALRETVSFPDSKVSTISNFRLSRKNRRKYRYIEDYTISQSCIKLTGYSEMSQPYGIGTRGTKSGTWLANPRPDICLESKFLSLGSQARQYQAKDHPSSLGGLLAFFTDYWLEPPVQSVRPEFEGCSSSTDAIVLTDVKLTNLYAILANYGTLLNGNVVVVPDDTGFVGYQEISTSRYSDLINDYEKNKKVYDLFLPVIKILDTDGGLKKLVSAVLKFGEGEVGGASDPNICSWFKATNGDFYRNTYFNSYGFWERRDLDGTTDQTLEILRKLQKILAD